MFLAAFGYNMGFIKKNILPPFWIILITFVLKLYMSIEFLEVKANLIYYISLIKQSLEKIHLLSANGLSMLLHGQILYFLLIPSCLNFAHDYCLESSIHNFL